MRRIWPYLLTTALVTAPLLAQQDTTDDEAGGLLVRTIEGLLSGDNRSVQVIGLEGALSSRARLEELRISDDEGPWLILRGAVLDWNRLALLRGNFSINQLVADEIILARPPNPTEAPPDLPDPEAQPFQVPELPVRITISEISIPRIALGEPVIGIAAELALDGAFSLGGGALDARIDIDRLDRPGDQIGVLATFSNETSQIGLDIEVVEAAGGLISEALKIPDRPSLGLIVAGTGPVSDFTADITLSSAGEDRLSGQVVLQEAGTGVSDLTFSADLGGDVRALLAPDLRAFFGPETALRLNGANSTERGLRIDDLALRAEALDLTGALTLAPDAVLPDGELDVRIALQNGLPVRLPIPGEPTTLASATLSARLGDSPEQPWLVDLDISSLVRSDVTADAVRLSAVGQPVTDDATRLTGTIDGRIDGLDFADLSLADAVGTALTLSGGVALSTDREVTLEALTLEGEDYLALVDVVIDGLDTGFNLQGRAAVEAQDLTRFSGLAGQSLGGRVAADVTGSGSLLGGVFDLELTAEAEDLATGIAQVDPLLEGDTSLGISIVRDTSGVTLRRFALDGTALDASASGVLTSGASEVTLNARLDDLGRVLPEAPGPVEIDGTMRQQDETWVGDLDLSAPRDTRLTLAADLAPNGTARIGLDGRLGDLEGLTPPGLAPVLLEGAATRQDASWTGNVALSAANDSRIEASGTLPDGGSATARLDATVEALEGVLPAALAPLDVTGTLDQVGDDWAADLQLGAPADSRIAVQATLAAGGNIDATLTGAINEIEGIVPAPLVPITIDGTAGRTDGTLTADLNLDGAEVARINVSARQPAGEALGLTLDAVIEAIEGILPAGAAPIRVNGTAEAAPDGALSADLQIGAPNDSEITLVARQPAGDALNVRLDALVNTLDGLVPASVTPVRLDANLTGEGTVWDATARMDAALGTLTVDGQTRQDGTADVTLDGRVTTLSAVGAPDLGPLTLGGGGTRSADGAWTGAVRVDGEAGSFADVQGELTEAGAADLSFDAALTNLARFVPDFPGNLAASGTAARRGTVWTISTDATGPAGITARVAGDFDEAAMQADITATGALELGAANRILSPNALGGRAQFDLALQGPPELASLSGTISTSGSRFVVPTIGQTVSDINATITLADARAQIDASGGLGTGGQFVVSGPIGLTAPFPADIRTRLESLVLTDNNAVRTTADGEIAYSGSLTGGSAVTGTINFPETEINIAAASGAAGASPIPDIDQVNAPADVRETLRRADLLQDENARAGDGPAIALDLTFNAPNRVFVRGRGLQAELGGAIRVRGTSANVIPSGQIELIRGRLDILGRRLDLTEGNVSLQGRFEPFISFTAATSTEEGTAELTISGPLSQPVVDVVSSPPRPPEEALALLIFGNRFADLSPIRIAQMGLALAKLSGTTGGGTDSVRERLGLDALNVGTDEDGEAQVGAGAYLGENIYSEVQVNAQGESEVILNLDVSDSVTLKGSVDNSGETGLGIFFERDF